MKNLRRGLGLGILALTIITSAFAARPVPATPAKIRRDRI
jgi:hypothetical protein